MTLANSAASAQAPSEDQAKAIAEKTAELNAALERLQKIPHAERHLADVAVYAKAAEWIARHEEFYKPEFADQTLAALRTGLARAKALEAGPVKWDQERGRRILAYRSAVDESIQPYAITVPGRFSPVSERRLPLYVVLHGRGSTLNEVSFIHEHDGKPPGPEEERIQLDVFGRTNNAYRWAGETDVFEALADVRRRYRIDDLRIVLHGFSMGGAGSWHLGLHYPSLWCSVGPGAGFVDFYKYQKVETPLPPYQDLALHIYNPIDYVLNASDVPICTYGGEKDEQLAASTDMVAAAEKLNIGINLLIGPGVGHTFHTETKQKFMAFHYYRAHNGRVPYPGTRSIRFVTYTPKYNICEWLTIEELNDMYQPATVEGGVDLAGSVLKLTTKNVAVLQIARDIAEEIELDGVRMPLLNAARGLLPGVYYSGGVGGWHLLDYDTSLVFPKNSDMRKRHNLQGPIDDAFMQPFVCVRGTGTAWNAAQAAWADWTLERFRGEFDKWMRGRVPVVNDTDVTAELIRDKGLILFGDPGSNSILAKLLPRLPVKWTREALVVNGQSYDPTTNGLSMIYPNPMNPRRYVVVNSGHTFHAEDFQKSNAWLFPRLGDVAVQKFEKGDAGYSEEVKWAGFFDSNWQFPAASK